MTEGRRDNLALEIHTVVCSNEAISDGMGKNVVTNLAATQWA